MTNNEIQYFKYGDKEKDYLSKQDPILAEAIAKIGHIYRPVQADLFSSLVHSIVGQQISKAAHATVWNRIVDTVGDVTPNNIYNMSAELLQSEGLSMRKTMYIKEMTDKVQEGSLDLQELMHLSDEQVCKRLVQLKGIGQWTAEMLLLFSMQRPNILSFGDLAIQRGMCTLYGYEKLTKQLFLKHKEIYSPYASTASLYIWEISSQ